MKKLAVLCIVVMFVSCASLMPGNRGRYYTSGITTKTDEFEGSNITRCNLSMHMFVPLMECALGFIHNGSTDTYSMYTYIYKSGWMFIRGVKIKVDGRMYEFSSIRHSRNVVSGSHVEETNYYRVTPLFVEKLAYAQNVELRLYGKDHYVEPTMKESHIKQIQSFYGKTRY